jgi:hypothetical protein
LLILKELLFSYGRTGAIMNVSLSKNKLFSAVCG